VAEGLLFGGVLEVARMAWRTAAGASPAPGSLAFRSAHPALWETVEQRRRCLRDELLLAGDDPSAWTFASALADASEPSLAAEPVDGDFDQELNPLLALPALR
jgi:hypothetical protein